MASLLDLLQGREVRHFDAGQVVLQQGETTGHLYVLIEGAVEVMKDDVVVVTTPQAGNVFGEMSALLGGSHTATVRSLRPCSFFLVTNPREFLESSPPACLYVCKLLARRLNSLNLYLVDVKHQFEGHDHLGMVDQVLETLMHRQPRERVRRNDSTIRHDELPD